jgi:hypothetical protein
MKVALVFLSLLASSVSANVVSELAQADCTRKCSVYSFNFQPDASGLCQQVEKCDIYSWNSDEEVCEVAAVGELVTYPLACRDIPAY